MKPTDSKESKKHKGAKAAEEKAVQDNAKKDTAEGSDATRSTEAGRAGNEASPMLPADEGLHAVDEPKDMVLNSQVRDSGSKTIFDDKILCSQFLRDYIDLPYLKDVQPEDIEDVSGQYVTMFAQERNSDRVKRVHIGGGKPPFFLVSLIEHKTKPDYNVCMQIFRYMVHIWNTYEKEAEQLDTGMSKRQGFLYPPILPVVYYEGPGEWNVPLDFKSRIRQGEAFGRYLPDFEYYLVPLREYSNEMLLEKRDEISLVLLINKLQTKEDVARFRELPGDEIEAILKDTPPHLLNRIAEVLQAFLLKLNVPVEETEKLTDKVREKKMAELFADMEKMDIQEERRKTDMERKRADEAQQLAAELQQQITKAQQQAELGVESLIEVCQGLGLSRDSVIQKLMDKNLLSREEALEKIEKYWAD